MLAAVPTIALWPGVAMTYVILSIRKRLGISSSFFVAPPKIETPDERKARLLNEREARLDALEKDIELRERELKIGLSK